MAKNRRFANGRKLTLPVVAGAVSGDAVIVGDMAGVALTDRDAAGNSAVDFGGAYRIPVKGINGAGNSAVAIGDRIYLVAGDTPKASKVVTGVFIGYAIEAVASGATATVAVLLAHGGSPV